MLAIVALLVSLQPAPSPSPAVQARPDVAAEVERGVRAYNAQDLAYYDSTLAPDVVYIADDGAVFTGKPRVMELFTRIFAMERKPHLEITGLVTGGQGDAGRARFSWMLSGNEHARPGVATVILERTGGRWQVVSIQNTARGGHMMRASSPAPGAAPSPAATPKP